MLFLLRKTFLRICHLKHTNRKSNVCTKFLTFYANKMWHTRFSFVIHLKQSLPLCEAVGHRNPLASYKHLLSLLQATGPRWKTMPPPQLSARPQKGNEMLSGTALQSPKIQRYQKDWSFLFWLLLVMIKNTCDSLAMANNTENWLNGKRRIFFSCEKVSNSSKTLST